MRTVKSRTYFEQMKGRGVRVIDDTDFQAVTDDAEAKDRFLVVDAVGSSSTRTRSEPSRCSTAARTPAVELQRDQGTGAGDQRPPRQWTPDLLWRAYEVIDQSKVRGSGHRMLADIVALVRYTLHQDHELVPFRNQVEERFVVA